VGLFLGGNALYRLWSVLNLATESLNKQTETSTPFSATPETQISNNPLTVEEVLENPSVLKDKTVDEVREQIGNSPGWQNETMRHSESSPGGGWVLRE
jgi:hypothetical protein